MANSVTKIVDVTIAYPEGKPLNLVSIMTGSRGACDTHVHYRIFDVKEVSFASVETCRYSKVFAVSGMI